jgi:hypothetical protein
MVHSVNNDCGPDRGDCGCLGAGVGGCEAEQMDWGLVDLALNEDLF